MITIETALHALGIDGWVLRGEPTTEDEFNQMFRKVTGADSNNNAIESDKPSDFGVTWKQVSDKKKALEDAEPMRLLRRERDRLLSECDWVVTKAKETSTNVPAAWKTYRQELRDLPSKYNDTTVQETITWPDEPS